MALPDTPSSTASISAPAVTLTRVSQLFGEFVALRDVSLELPSGSSVMLLGPNGAGKSTLLKIIAGLASPTYGEVRVWGEKASYWRGRIAYMSHSTMLYDELTAAENLTYLLGLERPDLREAECARKAADALAAVKLDPAANRRLGQFSQGMRQRASLARVLLTEPDLLLLDEPFSNLDVASVSAMLDRLRRYVTGSSASGLPRTMVLTTHQAELARPLANLVLTLEASRLEQQKPPLANTQATIEAHAS